MNSSISTIIQVSVACIIVGVVALIIYLDRNATTEQVGSETTPPRVSTERTTSNAAPETQSDASPLTTPTTEPTPRNDMPSDIQMFVNDSERLRNIISIEGYLAIYITKNGQYPETLDQIDFADVPVDPKTGAAYFYIAPDYDRQTYQLAANVEDPRFHALRADADAYMSSFSPSDANGCTREENLYCLDYTNERKAVIAQYDTDPKYVPPEDPKPQSALFDGTRIGDIRRLQLSCELYFDKFGMYPESLQEIIDNQFIKDMPTDPTTGAEYFYTRLSTTDFHLGANLGGADNYGLDDDADYVSTAINGLDDSGCDGSPGQYCYDIRP